MIKLRTLKYIMVESGMNEKFNILAQEIKNILTSKGINPQDATREDIDAVINALKAKSQGEETDKPEDIAFSLFTSPEKDNLESIYILVKL